MKIAYDWTIRAEAAQRPPDMPGWRVWLFLGGRGAGKTRAGAEWLRAEVAARRSRRVALVGPTLGDVREVMIEGPSGLRAIAPTEARPTYHVSRRRLDWPCGARAHAFSAEDAESLRGPQFDSAWCDELAAWPGHGGGAAEVWDMLMFAVRLGPHPRVAATTTPRASPLLRRLIEQAGKGLGGVTMTRAPTRDNAGNLAPGFVEAMEEQYAGTRRGRQELDGELIEDPEGAMWSREVIERARVRLGDIGKGEEISAQLALSPAGGAVFDRVVVAVDPPVSSGPRADACGIVAAGRLDGVAYILADASARGLKPLEWAARAVALARRWGAGEIVAEANQGGEMVRQMLEMAGASLRDGVRVKLVHAYQAKAARAAPVSGHYASGRVKHAGVFGELEDEMCAFGVAGERSPDRVDAMVWAVRELLGREAVRPRVDKL